MTGREGYAHCNGCGVCTLSCPIWQQGHEAQMTFMGRALALQRGVEITELEESVNSCILCGSCEPVCLMGISTVDITLRLRSELAGKSRDDWHSLRQHHSTSGQSSVLVASEALRKHSDILNRTASLLDIPVANDDGSDILEAFEKGLLPDQGRTKAFLGSFDDTKKVIAGDGLMVRFLRATRPGLEVIGMGKALLGLPRIRASLTPTDLYIIEARSYNLDFHRCAPFYTEISRQTGCAMNMDLQRIAIPTRAYGREDVASNSIPETNGQTKWILEGMSFERIVVEAVEDIDVLSKAAGVPVMHLAEIYRDIV